MYQPTDAHAQAQTLSMGSGFGSTGAYRTFGSCLKKKRACSQETQFLRISIKEERNIDTTPHRPVAEEAVLDDFNDEGSCIFFTQTRVESLPEYRKTL